jgi:hypothetical protein
VPGSSGNKQANPRDGTRSFWYQAEKEIREMDDLRDVAKEPLPSVLPG